jgi:spermidine synthase
MYHVAGTGLVFSVLYLLSLFLCRSGFFDVSTHRKIWNSILALTFIFVALAGLFMALQINYKWNVPFIKQLLKWHVEIGAGCALAGLFHLSWHLTYFKGIFKVKQNEAYHEADPASYGDSIPSSLLLTGFVSMSVQILIAREIFNIAGGYELITGVFLGSWLVTSAAGALAAGRSPLSDLKKVSIFFSVTPFISLLFLILFTRFFMGTGETPSFLVSMILCIIVLFPFCFVSGFTFIKLLAAGKEFSGTKAGSSYAVETIGGAFAGFILTVLTSGSFNTYKIFLVITLLSLAFSLLVFYVKPGHYKLGVKIFFTLLISLLILSDPDVFFRRLLLPGIAAKSTTDTPYGNLTRGRYSGEEALYYNSRLLSYSNDVIESEEDIHFAMLQRPGHKNVIIVSGNVVSLQREVEKYNPQHITFIERDPVLIQERLSKDTALRNNITLKFEDAWSYIRKQEESADAIILLVPPPSTLSLNRYYTSGFFKSVRKSLTPGGVFICSPAPGDDYLNSESISLCSSVFNTLSGIFKYVSPVVGHKLWLLASDEELSVSFCKLARERDITNTYVGPDYISDDLTEAKTKEVLNALEKKAGINTAAFPVAALRFQSYNLSRNTTEKIPSIILMILLFALPLAGIKRRNIPMCIGASALAGFEIITLLAIQLSAGNMYQLTGLTLALFMAGLAAGSGINTRNQSNHSIKHIIIALAIFYVLAGFLIIPLTEIRSGKFAAAILLAASLLPSFLTGIIFRNITNNNPAGSSTASVYSSDLMGSAFGFMVVSAVMVPMLGIPVSLFILSGLILASLLFGTKANK